MSVDRFVKICGLRDAASAQVAIDSGADALGFILAKSRRQIVPEEIRAIRRSLAPCVRDTPRSRISDCIDTPNMPPFVGVVVNATTDDIAFLITKSGVDMIQLSGDESPDILASIDVPVIKALRFPYRMPVEAALEQVSAWLDGPHPARHVIVEGHADGFYGGTGTRADWSLVAEVATRYPVILAGGLDPDNVGDAVVTVRPFGVDVSSGIETDGLKDTQKIQRFIERAKRYGNGDE